MNLIKIIAALSPRTEDGVFMTPGEAGLQHLEGWCLHIQAHRLHARRMQERRTGFCSHSRRWIPQRKWETAKKPGGGEAKS